MAGLPQFIISTQTDPYWEIPLFDKDGNPLSVEGRVFEAWIAQAETKQGVAEPPAAIKVLTFQDGLSLVPPTDGSGDQTIKNTFVHQVSRAFAQANFPRGELTADLLEVVDGKRRLFSPVRLFYGDPAQIREFVADRAGIVFGQGRQPIVTPVAIAGRVGARGSGVLSETRPPTASDGEDGDFFIEDQSALGRPRLMYGPKANGSWPTPWVIQAPGTHTPVADLDYQCLPTDQQVGMVTLTTPRTVFLPDVDTFPLGTDLVIADESGACSDVLTITIRPGPGTDDVLGVSGGILQLFDAYQSARFRRGAANLWIRL